MKLGPGILSGPGQGARRWLEYVSLDELKKYPGNPKDHALDDLAESAARFGFNDPVAVDERTGRLLEGHGRCEYLEKQRAAGAAPPDGVELNAAGEWLVPVVRGIRTANDTEAESYLIAHNAIGEKGGWDRGRKGIMVKRATERGAELARLGLRRSEVTRLISETRARSGVGAAAGEKQIADAELLERWGAAGGLEQGRTWRITSKKGSTPHVLHMGDSTQPAQVDALLAAMGRPVAMVAGDPPYAIFGSSTGQAADITDDAMVRPFFEAIFVMCARVLPVFGHAYIACDWRSWAAIWASAKRAGLRCANKIVWDKGDGGLGSMWRNCYEEVGFFVKDPADTAMGHRQAGHRTIDRANLQRHDRPKGIDRMHNAAKPIGLMVELIEASSDVGQVVLDPFCGSGSTLVAAEQVGRLCATMEIDAKSAAITLQRCASLGLIPVLV